MKKNLDKSTVSKYALIFFVLFVMYSLPAIIFSYNSGPLILLLYSLNVLLLLYSIRPDNSALVFFNSSSLVFIIYPFYLQKLSGFNYVNSHLSDATPELFFYYAIFLSITNYLGTRVLFSPRHDEFYRARFMFRSNLFARLILLSATTTGLAVFLFGAEVFLPRNYANLFQHSLFAGQQKFFLGVMKTVPYWTVYFYILRIKGNIFIHSNMIGLVVLLTIAIFISNPVNTERFLSLFGVFIVFFACVKIGRFRFLWDNSYLLCVASLVILPASSMLRIGVSGLDLRRIGDFLYTLEFSSLAILNDMFYLQFSSDLISNRILSAIFILVPRSIWPSKNPGTGIEIAESAGYIYTNVGVPPIADGYLDFGVFGVLLISAATGLCISYIRDSVTGSKKSNESASIGIKISLVALIPMFLRGDFSTFFVSFYTVVTAFFLVRYIAVARTRSPRGRRLSAASVAQHQRQARRHVAVHGHR